MRAVVKQQQNKMITQSSWAFKIVSTHSICSVVVVCSAYSMASDCISHGANETWWGSRSSGRSSAADPFLPSSYSGHIFANTQSICRDVSFLSKYQMEPAN